MGSGRGVDIGDRGNRFGGVSAGHDDVSRGAVERLLTVTAAHIRRPCEATHLATDVRHLDLGKVDRFC